MFLEIIYPPSVIILGLSFILISIKSKSDRPVWAKKAIFLVGLFAITKGLLVIMLNNQIIQLNPIVKSLIEEFTPFFGGMIVGILIVLLISKQVSFTKKIKTN